MSQRVVVVVGGCLLLAVGVLVGQSSKVVQNDEKHRSQAATDAERLRQIDRDRRQFENRQASQLHPLRNHEVRTADVDHASPTNRHEPFPSAFQPEAVPAGKIAQSGNPPKIDNPFGEDLTPPGQLPRQPNASPIRNQPGIDAPQSLKSSLKSNSKKQDAAKLREIIRKELPNASPTEVEEYAKELKDHSAHDVKIILEMRRMHGSLLSTSRRNRGAPKNLTNPPTTSPVLSKPIVAKPPVARRSIAHHGDPLPAILQPTAESLRNAQKILLNNIANANTPGFKRTRIQFTDMPYQHVVSSKAYIGQGAQIVTSQRDWQTAPLRQTDQPLDIAISGDGFFQLQGGQQVLFSRSGRFRINADRNIVYVTGTKSYLLEPTISIPEGTTQIDISASGDVSALQPTAASQQLGRIQLARFANPDGLTPLGNSLFAATDDSGVAEIGGPNAEGRGSLKQGFLEMSNVDLKRELQRLQRVTLQLQAIQEAARMMAAPGDDSLQSLPASVPRPKHDVHPHAKRPTYRSLMNDLKLRTQSKSHIKSSSHSVGNSHSGESRSKSNTTSPNTTSPNTTSPNTTSPNTAEAESIWDRLLGEKSASDLERKLGLDFELPTFDSAR